MKKFIITFGQCHVHKVNGHNIDKDCVVRYEAQNHTEARDKAFAHFDDKFFTTYEEADFGQDSLEHFPRGIIDISL